MWVQNTKQPKPPLKSPTSVCACVYVSVCLCVLLQWTLTVVLGLLWPIFRIQMNMFSVVEREQGIRSLKKEYTQLHHLLFIIMGTTGMLFRTLICDSVCKNAKENGTFWRNKVFSLHPELFLLLCNHFHAHVSGDIFLWLSNLTSFTSHFLCKTDAFGEMNKYGIDSFINKNFN